MNGSLIDTLARTIGEGSASRRGMLQGLPGLMLAGSIARLGPADAEARNKKRKRKRKGKKKRKKGGDEGGGGGGNACQFTICDGQCVDLNSNSTSCGICGARCHGNETCVEGRCVAVIGSQGDGDGEFQDPTGIALNAAGVAYVTDTGNDRLVFLDGGEVGDVDLVQPIGVAVNRISGDIYVSDLTFDSVMRVSASGVVLNSFGGAGADEGQFQNPFGVAVDPFTGQVFIADTGNHRIQRFNAIGQPLGRFGREGGGEGEFRSPRDLVISGNGEVIVADTANNRVQVLDEDGNFLRAFGSEGSANGQFRSPVSVTVDSTGNIFVVDLDNSRVQQFTSEGQFITAFGRFGRGPGEFVDPKGIAIDTGGRIFVVDQGNHRVQRFTPGDLRALGADGERPTAQTQAGGPKARKRRASRGGDNGSRD